jgi:pSer/pThr/pTyr-binding forkhead associated (FHA) protein
VTPAAATPAPPPAAPAQDAGATQYHSVGSSKSGLVGVLIVKEGAAKDEIHKVFDGENTIGRGEAAEIRTDNRDDAVSREHAMIIHESGNFGIKPLKEGTNPTFLNNNEVSGGATLADGDLIRVGNTTLKFRVS